MSTTIDDIREQEEDIFKNLGPYDFQNEPLFKINQDFVKSKARQQLDVSMDSPFSTKSSQPSEQELRKLKEEKVALLRQETEEIKKQLEIVKSRLDELKLGKNQTLTDRAAKGGDQNDEIQKRREPTTICLPLKRPLVSCKSNNKDNNNDSNNNSSNQIGNQSTKLRPLTGTADCPNCVCDRRSSVCDRCIKFAVVRPLNNDLCPTFERKPTNVSIKMRNETFDGNYDDRPIRPAKERTLKAKVEVVDDLVLPNRIYTIGKSLDNKRTKLAQAIEDLQLMMDRVKKRGDKLEQDRKLAQLYKDQWKFGPSIGGPSASPRARLGGQHKQQQNYRSRLDPNLARDSNSLMGFQHIEPTMKLRQYNGRSTTSSRAKITSSSISRLANSRSRSLESLRTAPKTKTGIAKSAKVNGANFQNGKSSSEVNLASSPEAIEEEIEEEIQDIEGEPEKMTNTNNCNENNAMVNDKNSDEIQEDRVQKMTWIPVFGETEIKTIKRAPKRKVLRQDSRSSQVVSKQPESVTHFRAQGQNDTNLLRNRNHNTGRKSATSNTIKIDRVVSEASRKIQFANNLLEREHQDSRTRNQILVNQHQPPTPRPRQSKTPNKAVPPSSRSSEQQQSSRANNDLDTTQIAQNLIADATKEISRLEVMISEQHKLLTKLANQAEDKHQLNLSPVTVRCASPCCHHIHHKGECEKKSTSGTVSTSINNNNSRALINHLKERLNKTKARLARTLEEEREKHEQLKEKVDSSLRKQSDLENENELLKQSLSKCIDTCLKDISSTFESISDTLTDSIVTLEKDEPTAINLQGSSAANLTNAAQLIVDNSHLRKMKSIIEMTESQRKRIFDELKDEKQRSSLLETQLEQSRNELNNLIEAKQRLESELASIGTTGQISNQRMKQKHNQELRESDETCEPVGPKPSCSWRNDEALGDMGNVSITDDSTTYNSVDAYRHYLQSMSPDLESIKRERKLILSEFDNIKKMLSDMEK